MSQNLEMNDAPEPPINLHDNLNAQVEPPNNMEAEQQLLGIILFKNDIYFELGGVVQDYHFYHELHGRIFNKIAEFIESKRAATPVTLKHSFAEDGDFTQVGGAKYLAQLITNIMSTLNSKDLAGTIIDMWKCREVIYIAEHAKTAAYNSDNTDFITEIEAEFNNLNVDEGEGDILFDVGDVIEDAINAAIAHADSGQALIGISTGFESINQNTGGFQKKEVFVLAARPSMGKTAIGVCMFYNTAKADHPSLYFSLEMGVQPIAQRMIADSCFTMGSRIDEPIKYSDIRKNGLSGAKRTRALENYHKVKGLDYVIDQRPGLRVSQMAASIRKYKAILAKEGKVLGVVYIDHFHLIKPEKSFRGNTESMLTEISGDVSALAKNEDVAIVLMCQLNRANETLDDKRPQLSSLRGSGAIEQNADTVAFIYRHDYYVERSKPTYNDAEKMADWNAEMYKVQNVAEFIIGKQRNGPIDTIELFQDMACNAFRDKGVAR